MLNPFRGHYQIMNNQRYFHDTIWFLRRQTSMPLDQLGLPVYLGSNGNRSATARLIPDGHPALVSRLPATALATLYMGLQAVVWPPGPVGLVLVAQLQELEQDKTCRIMLRTDTMPGVHRRYGGLSLAGESKASRIANEFDLTYLFATSFL
jgi:hypothetical protein